MYFILLFLIFHSVGLLDDVTRRKVHHHQCISSYLLPVLWRRALLRLMLARKNQNMVKCGKMGDSLDQAQAEREGLSRLSRNQGLMWSGKSAGRRNFCILPCFLRSPSQALCWGYWSSVLHRGL